MSTRNTFVNKKLVIFIFLLVMVVIGTVLFGYQSSESNIETPVVTEIARNSGSEESPAGLSKVILTVRNMSCSGCISTIKGSLAPIQGIKDVLVDVGNGKAEIYYESDKLKDVSLIAKAITASGYPAEVIKIVSAEEMKKEKAIAAAKSQYYIASVSGWDISKADFETELGAARKRYSRIYGNNLFNSARGDALLDSLKKQIVSKLINEGIMMQEINKSGFQVDPASVEAEFQSFLKKHGKSPDEFKQSLSEVGYDPEYFRKKFETKVFINKYISEKILRDASNEYEKQNLFNAWFNNSRVLAKIVYYDKDLERLTQSQSASGSCCPAQ